MPQTRDIAIEQLTAAGDALPVMETRVDSAHSIGDALVRKPALAEMPVAEAITDLVRVEGAVQLQSQADQLAAHLRVRQQELDRREAQLNSRLADFEKEVREARLWLSERNHELNEREARIEGSGFRVQGSGDTDTDGSVGSVGNGTGAGPRGVPREHIVTDVWDLRRSVSRQDEELDRRGAALELFQEKVSQMHREALELRLAAEEAQAELRSSLGLELAEDALILARERLARYFREEVAELTRKREELEWLKMDLAAEHDRLQHCYEELKERTASNGVDSTRQNPLLTSHLPTASGHSPLTTHH